MDILVVGASGYLGAEILHQADVKGHNAVGTYCHTSKPGLVKFDLEDKATWKAIGKPDVVIWAAWSDDDRRAGNALEGLLALLRGTKFIYVSSDIVLCDKALKADSSLGDYARYKRVEQEVVLVDPEAAVFTVGPIYGQNSDGVVDKRTQPLLAEPNKTREYWDNVYKTFVPVKGLAKTLLVNLDKNGRFLIGPPERMSYFEFYKARAQAHGLPSGNFHPIQITDEELAALDQCVDLSYSDDPGRLWSDSR